MIEGVSELELECVKLFSASLYHEVLGHLEALEFRDLSARLRLLRALSGLRLGRHIDALRWLHGDPDQTPILRRVEIEILCALRRHREIVARIEQSFNDFPPHALDYAFFALTELVFHQAFLEARYVLDKLAKVIEIRIPGSLQDFCEKKKYIDGTEALLDKVLFDPRYELIEVKRRLKGLDIPTITWANFISQRLGKDPAIVSDIFSTFDVDIPMAGSSCFWLSRSAAPIKFLELPTPKTTTGFVIHEAQIINVDGENNLSVSSGIIFPELASQNSLINSGYCLGKNDRDRVTISRCIMLPPLGDPGQFNAILNGVFGLLVWRYIFSDLPFVVPVGYSPILRNFASLLGDAESKIIWDEDCALYRFESACVIFNEGRTMDGLSLAVFRKLANELLMPRLSEAEFSHRIYISRRKAHQRHLIEESVLEEKLQKIGFKVVYLENLSIELQILACANAEVVVAPHGAGLTNIVFSRNLKLLVELIPQSYHVRGFENLARGLGASYVGVIGEPVGGNSMADLTWKVDPDLVCRLVSDGLHGEITDISNLS